MSHARSRTHRPTRKSCSVSFRSSWRKVRRGSISNPNARQPKTHVLSYREPFSGGSRFPLCSFPNQTKEILMRLSARRICSLNHTLAVINGRSIYNDDKRFPPATPDRSYTHTVYHPPSHL